jgi:hypothetical protein
MNTNQTLNKVRTLLGIEIKLEQMKLDNGAVFEAEVFEAGAEIFVVADEERVAVPVGEYKTEDGMVIVIEEEGIIGEIKDAESEEEEAEAPVQEEEVVEEEMSTESASPKKIVKSISEEMFFSEIEKLRNEINELKLSKVEVKEVEEVSVELSSDEVEVINHNPENKTSEKELNLYSQKGKNNVLNNIFKQISK